MKGSVVFGILIILTLGLGVAGAFSEDRGAFYFGGAILCLIAALVVAVA